MEDLRNVRPSLVRTLICSAAAALVTELILVWPPVSMVIIKAGPAWRFSFVSTDFRFLSYPILLLSWILPPAVIGAALGRRVQLMEAVTPQRIADFAFTTFALSALCTSVIFGVFAAIEFQHQLSLTNVQMNSQHIVSCVILFAGIALLDWLLGYVILLFPLVVLLGGVQNATGWGKEAKRCDRLIEIFKISRFRYSN